MPVGCLQHRDPSNGMSHQDPSKSIVLYYQLEFLLQNQVSGIQEAISTQTHEIEYLWLFV
jgi:hypothetical protein